MSEPQRLGEAVNPVYAELQARHEAATRAQLREIADAGVMSVTISLGSMSREGDVRRYAYFHGLSLTDAIVALINAGLSHIDGIGR